MALLALLALLQAFILVTIGLRPYPKVALLGDRVALLALLNP